MTRDQVLNIRVSSAEMEAIKARAEEKHVPVSTYVRMIIFGGANNDGERISER